MLSFTPTLSAVLLILSPTAVLAATQSVTIYAWPLTSKAPSALAEISYDPETLSATVDKYTPPPHNLSASTSSASYVRIGLYDNSNILTSASTSDWRGSLTSLSSFDPALQHKLTLHIDDLDLANNKAPTGNAAVWHVDFSSYSRTQPATTQPAKKTKASKPKSAKAVEKEREREGKAKLRAEKQRLAKARAKAKKEGVSVAAVEEEAEKEAVQTPLVVEIVKTVEGPVPVLNRPVVLSPDGKGPEPEKEKTLLQKYWWAIALFMVLQLVMGSTPPPDGQGQAAPAKK